MGQLATRRSSACLSRSAIFSPGWISGPLSEHAEHQTVQAQSRVVGVPRLCSLPGHCQVKLTSCVVSQTLCLLPELSIPPFVPPLTLPTQTPTELLLSLVITLPILPGPQQIWAGYQPQLAVYRRHSRHDKWLLPNGDRRRVMDFSPISDPTTPLTMPGST